MAFPFMAIPAAISAASAIGGFLQKPQRVSIPDISAELARIRSYYETARQNAIANIKHEAGQMRGQAASNLAARGIYRAPVSENVFGRLREATGRDIATAEANIGVQSADAQSRALAALLGAQQQAQQFNAQAQAQRQAAIFGGLGSLGSALLQYGMNRPTTTGSPTAYPNVSPVSAQVPSQYALGVDSQNLFPAQTYGVPQYVPSQAAAQFATLFRRPV